MEIRLLDLPEREDHNLLRSTIIAAIIQKHLRNSLYEISPFVKNAANFERLFSTEYVSDNKIISERDIRKKLGPDRSEKLAFYGEENATFKSTYEMFLTFLDFLLGDLNQFPIKKAAILDPIRKELEYISNQFDDNFRLDQDPNYRIAISPIIELLEVGISLGLHFYTGQMKEVPDICSDVNIGTRFLGGSLSGRPVIVTTSQMNSMAINFNCISFNAYYQLFLPFLMAHELTSHYWPSNQKAAELDTSYSGDNLFEEGFVQKVFHDYMQFTLDDNNIVLFHDQLNQSPITKNRNAFSVGALKDAFNAYSQFFYNRYCPNNPSYSKACKLVKGLTGSIISLLVQRQDKQGFPISLERLRKFTVDLATLNIPLEEKNEFIDSLFPFFAPTGEVLFLPSTESASIMRIVKEGETNEIFRKKAKQLLTECSVETEINVADLITRVSQMEINGEAEQLFRSANPTIITKLD